jgi:hypothetical protein
MSTNNLADLTVEQRAYVMGLRVNKSTDPALIARLVMTVVIGATAAVLLLHAIGTPIAPVPPWAYNIARFVAYGLVSLLVFVVVVQAVRDINLDVAISGKFEPGGLHRLHKLLTDDVPSFNRTVADRIFRWPARFVILSLVVAMAADGRVILGIVYGFAWMFCLAVDGVHRDSWFRAVRGLTVAEIREMEAGVGRRSAA